MSDSGQRCLTQGPSNKVGVMCVLGCMLGPSFFLYKVNERFDVFFHHRTLMAAPHMEVQLRGVALSVRLRVPLLYIDLDLYIILNLESRFCGKRGPNSVRGRLPSFLVPLPYTDVVYRRVA